MKNLRSDDEGIIPILIGAAVVSLLGLSWLSDTSDPWALVKVVVVASLMFIVGLYALMGKLVLLGRFVSVIVGLGLIAGSVYLVYLGRFPI